jgi:dipeptidyl aminopeptidase/acylaminoacyl peptidase
MRIHKQISTAVALSCLAAAASAATQPLEDFARRPQMYGVTISADGRYVSFLSGAGDDTVVMTFDRTQTGSAFRRVAASEPNKFDIGWCRWANDKRVVCGVFGNIRGKKYAEPPFRRLFAVNGDGSALKLLEKPREDANGLQAKTSMRNLNMNYGANIEHSVLSQYAAAGSFEFTGASIATKYSTVFRPDRQDEVIDFTPDDPDTVLIQSDEDMDGYPSIIQLNISTGFRGEKVPDNTSIQEYITDGRGNPRVGWGVTRDGEINYFARLDGENVWRRLAAARPEAGRNPLRPFAIGADTNTAYAYGVFEGRDALWSIDLTDKREPQLLFKHPLVDAGEPVLRSDRRLLGVRYDVERPYVWYANPKHRELIDRLEKQYPNRFHEIIDASADQKILLIQQTSDTDAGTYFIWDVEKEKLQKLGTAYPELDQKALGTMTNITYEASDGTEIPGYLTVPSGAQNKRLPLIVLPHDGPADRDSWKFSFLRNFLANRGYAVLQTNYRGSSGLGEKWRTDSRRDWSGLVYSDIQDATKWAIGEGIADPARICIMGWGFGGYQALLAATRTSDTYQCAISINGIADLEMQRDRGTAYSKNAARTEIGADKQERESPIANASKVQIPVLLIHGTKDWEVQIDHTEEMEDALSQHEKDVTTVVIKNATHDMARKSDRVTLLREIEMFLVQALGPGGTN